ncbi:undecaprenyldiphospho-muramoylpentapeptide beta-N-acetylglucosaminyltransferase [Methylovirgula sp. 4M-Z18]|uniref:undecaprenyldiphospho-muramoylpentapeptide beta-N-acetylglucosaminyltransferase n=1 Tax=Methylovirgula sp. 4M-Z18 TaxID=2293567 RepID=UPI000E2EF6BA|nr:undecaprenyldiphospho-muramoylpentapeptide beta-N-acetylglucosaminyltransferase [Methylovirgula sp. 4M-Z18]RFB79927.1 undecaprenyldiphospho-muramoylpentapeptide beta-N-acetylglucosaminyltransferase [Methylovirgula sp. 4M-Z18]
MSEMRPVLLSAGGTGGHLFPAEALAKVLQGRGVAVELMTDTRALQYGAQFPAQKIHAVPSATPNKTSIVAKAQALAMLALGTLKARALLKRINPSIVVGFGGYPTVPPLKAATLLKLPTLLHEQNAVMGRANRFLAKDVTAIATGFASLRGVDDAIRAKATHVGNPVRAAVIEAAQIPFPATDDGILRLLVTGGSQGARVMSEIVPQAVALMSPPARARLSIVQQARGEDVTRVKDAYAQLGVNATIEPFFKDLPARMAASHLVIGRSGASTVSELAVIGRPSILVPLPGALDQDQAANAQLLADIQAATLVRQSDFSAAWLAEVLQAKLDNLAQLRYGADAAKRFGIPDAAERLADLVLKVANRTHSET